MAILPISGVGVRNNPRLVPFGMRNDEDDDNNNGEGYKFPRRVQNKMVTIPLATLIAMTTMVANANEPVDNNLNMEKINKIEMVDQAPKLVQLDRKPYKLVRGIPVKEVISTERNGNKYYMIFAGGKPNDNVVDVVYFTNAKYTGRVAGIDNVLPGTVSKLILHKGEKPTMGVVYSQQFEGNNKSLEDWTLETIIPPECANPLIDLMVGESQWKYQPLGGKIKFEETNNPKPQMPKCNGYF